MPSYILKTTDALPTPVRTDSQGGDRRRLDAMESGSTFRLSPEQLARLLKVAMGKDQGKGPGEPVRGKEKPEGLGEEDAAVASLLDSALAAGVKELGGWPVGQVLLDDRADLEQLARIKQWAKSTATATSTSAEITCAKVLYYAAIAASLAVHGRKITRHSNRSLAASFDSLAGRPWMPAELAALFRRAGQSLLQR